MRKLSMLVLLGCLAGCKGGAGGGGAATAASAVPNTEQEKTLYALGLSVGKSLSVFSLTPADLAQVQRGLSDSVTNQKPLVALEEFGPKIQELARTRGQAKTESEKTKATSFLEKAAAEKGAEKLPSGLIYTELSAGTGENPKAEDTVKVDYKGTLVDGTEFDSSYKRGQPATFPLRGVIPCWTEGVQKMKVGGKARLVCPSSIGYGDRGAPPNIPGGAALIFEVELKEIVSKAVPDAGVAVKKK